MTSERFSAEPGGAGQGRHSGALGAPGTHSSWSVPLPQVYTVVDEMFLAGEIRETSQTKVLKQLLMLQSLE